MKYSTRALSYSCTSFQDIISGANILVALVFGVLFLREIEDDSSMASDERIVAAHDWVQIEQKLICFMKNLVAK